LSHDVAYIHGVYSKGDSYTCILYKYMLYLTYDIHLVKLFKFCTVNSKVGGLLQVVGTGKFWDFVRDKKGIITNRNIFTFLCPLALYYLRYAVTSFFTISRISLADGKTAGQKVHRKIAGAVQNVKFPLLFVPLF
jgi:hypothetical protein